MKRWSVWVVSLVSLVCMETPVCAADAPLVQPVQAAQASPPAQATNEESNLSFEFVLDARPASLFVVSEGTKFEANGATLSTLFYMPNIDAGVGMQIDRFYVDATVGGGMLVNDRFRSFTADATLAGSYAFTDSFTVGPRVGLVYFLDPEWLETNDVKFDSAPGFMAGLQIVLGDKISYVISVDYIDASLDASSKSGASLSDDQLTLTGLAFQFGVRGQF
jgi:hypothetical protein